MIPAWEILQELLTQCADSAKIDLSGEGTAPGIVDAAVNPARSNIFAVSVPYSRDQRDRFAGAINARPALVWCAPRKVRTPPSAGDNNKAWRLYTVLGQVLDTDVSLHSSDKLKARLKWENSIAQYVNMGNLRNEIFNTTDGMVTNAFVDDTDVIDERMFHLFDECVCMIPVTFKCLQPHDADGRV